MTEPLYVDQADKLGALLEQEASRPIWCATWAWQEWLERAFRLAELQEAAGELPPLDVGALRRSDPTRYLLHLRFEAYVRRYLREQERQMEACLALDLPWPAEPKTSPSTMWRWCFDPWVPPKGAAWGRWPLPVVYPSDWLPSVEPDCWGFGDTWRAGDVVVIGAAEVAKLAPAVSDVEPVPMVAGGAPVMFEVNASTDVMKALVLEEAVYRARDLRSDGRGLESRVAAEPVRAEHVDEHRNGAKPASGVSEWLSVLISGVRFREGGARKIGTSGSDAVPDVPSRAEADELLRRAGLRDAPRDDGLL